MKWLLIAALCLIGAPAIAASDIGIVLLHGKQGMPNDRVIGGLASRLESAGYRVEQPEMCYSRRRIYDLAVADCFRDIDAAVARLRAAGARRIVIAGQSQGGNMAIAYGSTHDGLAAIIGLAPAGDSSMMVRNPVIATAVQQARAARDPNERMSFADVNVGPQFNVTTTPAIYLSFHEPGSLSDITVTTPRLRAPLLWIAGDQDPTQRSGPQHAFAKAPPSPLNRYQVVSAAHLETPDAAREIVVAWLATLAQ